MSQPSPIWEGKNRKVLFDKLEDIDQIVKEEFNLNENPKREGSSSHWTYYVDEEIVGEAWGHRDHWKWWFHWVG